VHRYRCYIDRLYLGQPAASPGDNARFAVVLLASSRADAARRYWERYRDQIIPLLVPHTYKVSVHISGPGAISATSHNRSLAGRMAPILVYTKEKI